MHTAGAEYMTTSRNNRGKMRRSRFAKAGRNRDALAARHPGGKKIQESDNPQAVALAQPHRRHLPTIRINNQERDLRLDARAETQHGHYNLDGTISNQLYDAGERYREHHARYRAALAVPDSLARYTGGPGGVVADESARRSVGIFEAAFSVMDRRAQYSVGQVVLRGQRIGADIVHYRRGLQQLARHYGIGER